MARSTSLTKEECEAQLGARGAVSIGYEQRSIARKWLTAQGFPSAWACSLTFKQLNALYNRPDNVEGQFCIVKARLDLAAQGAAAMNAATANEPTSAPQTANAAPSNTAPAAGLTAQQQAALQAISGLFAPQAAVDPALVEAAVKKNVGEIIGRDLPDAIASATSNMLPDVIEALKQALPELLPVTRIELKKHDGTTHNIVGNHHPKFAQLLSAMSARQANGMHPNILLVGPTASGKTHAVHEAAKTLEKEFFCNGALSMDYQLIGFRDASGNYHETEFRRAFERPAVYLFDEIDSSDNSPLLALAGALANGRFAFPDLIANRHPDCVIIAAGNTWGHGATADFVGRNKLDAAIRSRFPVRISWDYDEKLERDISGNVAWAERVQRARGKARAAGLKVVIDPRMTQAGAGLIAAGMTERQAAELTFLADLTVEQRRMLGE